MEHEAETYILKAIEEREASQQHSYNQHNRDNSSVLSQIPDDVISALSTNDETEHNTGNITAPISPSHNAEATSTVASSTALGGAAMPGSPGAASVPPAGRRPSMYANQKPSQRPNRHITYHRRNQTMEQQLSGLASAIDAIQTFQDMSQSHNDNHTPTSVLPTLEEVPPVPDTSANALERNASLLYNRATARRKSMRNLFAGSKVANIASGLANETVSVGGGASSVEDNNSLLSMSKSYRNLHHYKKTDGDDPSNENISSSDNQSHGSSSHERNSSKSTAKSATEGMVYAMASGVVSEHLADIEEGGEPGSDNGKDKDKDKEIDVGADGDMNKNSTKSNLAATDPLLEKKNNKNRQNKKKNQTVRNLQDFFAPQKTTIALFFRIVFLYLSAPLLGLAAILFYWADCPRTGRLAYGGRPVNGTLWNTSGEPVSADEASISWWLIFVVRQLVTFTLAKCSERVFVDYLTIRSQGTMNILGPWVT